MITTFAVAPLFVRDCLECGCDVGRLDGRKLTATPEQIQELRDRATYYATEGLDAAPPSLIKSARTVLGQLDKLGL